MANPLPAALALDAAEMEQYIANALQAAEVAGVRGKDVTPFLLQYIATHTNGESLEANIALIQHNAAFGAQLAATYLQRIQQQ